MRTETRTVNIGEWLGPVDWSYDFRQHFDGLCTNDAGRDKACEEAKERLRLLTNGEEWEVTTYGGWPRCGWGVVVNVGMYDGWPYWRPVPSVAYRGVLGVEETSFCMITNIRRVSNRDEIL